MNCTDRDQDILLLEHGALSGVRRWSTERHLRACPRCQERREQHARLSGLVGAAVREAGPDLRVLYGGAAATAAASAGAVAASGAARLRPARPSAPALRPALVTGWAAAAAVLAAGAWAYTATTLAPGVGEPYSSAPVVATRPVVAAPRSGKAPKKVLKRVVAVRPAKTDAPVLPVISVPVGATPASTPGVPPPPPSADALLGEHRRA